MALTAIVKASLAISIVLLGRLALAFAQPVLTDDNTLRRLIGLSVEFSAFDVSPLGDAEHLVDVIGEDRTWDISSLTFRDPAPQPAYYSEPNESMPAAGDPRLHEANVVAVSDIESGTWTYQRLDETGHYLLARVTVADFDRDGRKDTLVATFDPISRVFPFPLAMGSTWADSTSQFLEFRGSPPVPVETVVASHVVEGWGTLISPDGMAPALRIRTEAHITAAGGQITTQRTIRVITPVPDDLLENTIYSSRVEMLVDSVDSLLALQYVSLSASRPIRVEPQDPLAGSIHLGPNYPNPFRGTTTIPLHLGDAGHVRISVFDIIGRRVAELLNEALPPGAHRVTWNAGTASSGVYRILLETRTSAASRLVVIRK